MAGVPYVGAPEIKARWTVLAVRYHSEIGNPGFNLFNTNTVTDINETYGSNWQRVQEIMQARYLRIGVELEW